MNVRISEKHGLNPTMPLCFWCGEEKGEIALLGLLPNDAEAPRQCVLDYEPCGKCAAEMGKGFLIIGTRQLPVIKGMPPIGEDDKGRKVWPSGAWLVITMEAAALSFHTHPEFAAIMRGKRMLTDDADVQRMITEANQPTENEAEPAPSTES